MTRFSRQILVGLAIFGVLFTQTSCVGAVMAAANHQEMQQRDAVKRWIAAHVETSPGCAEPVTLAPVVEYDFDRDTRDELIINASFCSGDMARANVNLVLSSRGEDDFLSLPIAELTPKQLERAQFTGTPHYRLSTKQGRLIATWMDDAKRTASPLTVKYQWDGQQFMVVDTGYDE